MSKKAFYAVLMVLIVPLICYFALKYYSESALQMPGHYIPDSVATMVKNGKQVNDTLWHKLPDFKLINQLGEAVTLDKYKNKVIIADFFFTHCPTICPPLTRNMKNLQESITNAQRVGDKTNLFIQFVSFSIDPERDSVPRLKQWADKFQINPENWDLLTGDKKTIYDLALNHLKLAVMDGKGVDEDFIHSDMFVLIDSSRNIRGYYRGLHDASLKQLSRDVVMLTLEKNHNEKNKNTGLIKIMTFVFLIAGVAIGLYLIMFKKKKNAETFVEKK